MIQYALLGLLREQSDYGYALKRRFERRVGTSWNLNVGQVYQTLRALHRAGFVYEVERSVGRAERDERHAERRVFAVTAKGARFLERWLRRAPAAPRSVRDELVVRLFVREPHRSSEMLGEIARQERLQRARLECLAAERDRMANAPGDDDLVRRLTLDGAIRHAEAHLAWLAHCRDSVSARLGAENVVASA
jgi:DNA-binding PadR family transcriptional regulator